MTIRRSLSWQDDAECLNVPWSKMTKREQIFICQHDCPVMDECRAFNDYMKTTGVVAGGRSYPDLARKEA